MYGRECAAVALQMTFIQLQPLETIFIKTKVPCLN